MKIEDLINESAVKFYSNERIFDFKASGFQFHFHENKLNQISSPKLKVKNKNALRLTNYEAAMGAHYAKSLGVAPIIPKVKIKVSAKINKRIFNNLNAAGGKGYLRMPSLKYNNS